METEQTKKLCWFVFGFLLTLVGLVLLIYLLLWLVLRPSKPQFFLQDASVDTFNFSSSTDLLTSSFEITLYSKNPNSRTGIYYDDLEVLATYQGHEITLRTPLPPRYIHHDEDCAWPLLVVGENVAVAPDLGNSLIQDQKAGMVMININVEGKIRWKVGSAVSMSTHLNVNCPIAITYGSGDNSGSGAAEIDKYQLVQGCNVDF